MVEISLELLKSTFPHKWKTPAASCLLQFGSCSKCQCVSEKSFTHRHTDLGKWRGMWWGQGIYWNGVQNSFLILRTWRTLMSSAYFVRVCKDAFAGGCATGLGWVLYGAACSCVFLSKTTLSSLLSQQRAQVSAKTNLDREHKQRMRKSQWRGMRSKFPVKR